MTDGKMLDKSSKQLASQLHTAVLIVLSALLFSMLFAAYWAANRWADETQKSILNSSGELGEIVVHHQIDAKFSQLRAVLIGFTTDPHLAIPFRNQDAQALDALVRPKFELLRRNKHLSHLYFISPERRVLRRLHHPDEAGDVVNRPSLIDAQMTRSASTGIDIGIDGALRLRVVAPYLAPDGTLLGYVEVASELLDVLSDAMQNVASKIFVLVKKESINRDKWLKFRRANGQSDNWDQFNDLALSSQSAPLPTLLEKWIKETVVWSQGKRTEQLIQGDEVVGVIALPLEEGHSHQIAIIFGVKNMNMAYIESRRILVPLTFLIILGSLVIVFGTHFGLRILERRLLRAEHDHHESEHNLRHDALTGALSRREFDRQLSRCHFQPVAGGIALLMMDLDHFKSINDTYGHQAGDHVLQQFVAVVGESIRPSDTIARFGGEEFAMLLTNVNAGGISVLSERILQAVRSTTVELSDGQTLQFTVSIGAVLDTDNQLSSTDIIKYADQALYRAKKMGRDRVCIDIEGKRAP